MLPSDALTLTFVAGDFNDNHDYVVHVELTKGPARHIVGILLSHDLLSVEKIEREERTGIALRLGLPRLRALIDADGVEESLADSDTTIIRLTTQTVQNGAVDKVRQSKSCVFMVRDTSGLICKVSRDNTRFSLPTPNATTLPVCFECGHPDDNVRCDELMHVTTEPSTPGSPQSPAAESGFRRNASGMCGLGYRVVGEGNFGGMTPALEAQRVFRCRIGERDCARLYWRAVQAPALAKADGRQLLREFDNLNLVADARFHFKPVTYPHGETMARIAGEVATQDEFANAISALGALIGAMQWRGVEGPSITALETFARSQGVALDGRAVRVLRNVARLRQAPPVHLADADAAAAAAALGIAYPPEDARVAWSQVRSIVTWAIATIGDAFREVSGPDSISP